MKRSLFLVSTLGATALSQLPPVHRLAAFAAGTRVARITASAAVGRAGGCLGHRKSTRWSGYTLADMLA